MKKDKEVKRTVELLTKLIRIHSHLYYCKNAPVISDTAFDYMEKTLKLIDDSAEILHLVGVSKCGRKKCKEKLTEVSIKKEPEKAELLIVGEEESVLEEV